MIRHIGWSMVALSLAHVGDSVQAQVTMAPVANPVDHPLFTAHPVRTAGAWRKGIEQFGETLASGSLRLRGYEVEDLKLPGNHGIDLVAIKRSPTGAVTDVRLVEVKAHYGQSKPRLGQTRIGTQMSRQWLTDRLRALHSSGEPGRKLALDITRFCKTESIPLERLGEIHDVNLRSEKYTIRNPISMIEPDGSMPIQRLLKNIASFSLQPASRAWVMRHLSEFDQLRQTRMGNWLIATPTARAFGRVSSTQIVMLEERQALHGVRRGLVRAAGRVAVVVAIAMDAYEIYWHVSDYRLGKICRQEFVIALARSGGGIAAAGAGAIGGAWIGVKIGSLGGPWAWVTVPAGGLIGGAIGGIAGYFSGSLAGEIATQAWYASLDSNVRDEISRWFKDTRKP